MPKCPHCHEEIDRLDWSETKDGFGFVVLRGTTLEYWENEEMERSRDLKHYCPLCKQLIATTEIEAMNFLAGINTVGAVE